MVLVSQFSPRTITAPHLTAHHGLHGSLGYTSPYTLPSHIFCLVLTHTYRTTLHTHARVLTPLHVLSRTSAHTVRMVYAHMHLLPPHLPHTITAAPHVGLISGMVLHCTAVGWWSHTLGPSYTVPRAPLHMRSGSPWIHSLVLHSLRVHTSHCTAHYRDLTLIPHARTALTYTHRSLRSWVLFCTTYLHAGWILTGPFVLVLHSCWICTALGFSFPLLFSALHCLT